MHGRINTILPTRLDSLKIPDGIHKFINIAVHCLDEYNFQDVEFIKQDYSHVEMANFKK